MALFLCQKLGGGYLSFLVIVLVHPILQCRSYLYSILDNWICELWLFNISYYWCELLFEILIYVLLTVLIELRWIYCILCIYIPFMLLVFILFVSVCILIVFHLRVIFCKGGNKDYIQFNKLINKDHSNTCTCIL